MQMTSRYLNIDDLGVSNLEHCISKNLGWICRKTPNSDVGIDATVEQVINGSPTAKYISIQLKTGLGNVHTDKDGNFTYYIDNIHYEYWLSSSVPVILALCDPEKEIIYWELVKKHNISKTDKKHKISILNTHQFNEDSLNELNTIIDTYQSDFILPESDKDDIYDTEYWEELLGNCAEAISNSTLVFNQLDNKYKSHIESMTKYINQNKNGVEKSAANKQISKHAKALKLAIDVCKTQFKSQIQVIAKTHIEAIRLAEQAFSNNTNIPNDVRNCIKEALYEELKTIEGSIDTFKIGAKRYSNTSSPKFELRQSEHSFALVLQEYVAESDCIVFWIKKLINTLENPN